MPKRQILLPALFILVVIQWVSCVIEAEESIVISLAYCGIGTADMPRSMAILAGQNGVKSGLGNISV